MKRITFLLLACSSIYAGDAQDKGTRVAEAAFSCFMGCFSGAAGINLTRGPAFVYAASALYGTASRAMENGFNPRVVENIGIFAGCHALCSARRTCRARKFQEAYEKCQEYMADYGDMRFMTDKANKCFKGHGIKYPILELEEFEKQQK